MKSGAADPTNPKLLQILICQVLQDIGLDRICAECRLILF
jgi:hypothetical protein